MAAILKSILNYAWTEMSIDSKIGKHLFGDSEHQK